MPELPEVETIARGVHKRVRGDRIVQAWFTSHPQPFKTPPARQAKGLARRTILAVHRTGKHIVFELGSSGSLVQDTRKRQPRRARNDSAAPEAQWIVHLGMTGRLLVTTPDCSRCSAHARAARSGQRPGVALCRSASLRPAGVPRSAARCGIRRARRRTAHHRCSANSLRSSTGRRLRIKAALLNQTLLAGVGNIYADESLFHAGIRPRRRANRLTRCRTRAAPAGAAPDPRPRHTAWRLLGLRLRRCRWRARLLSVRALRVPAHRPALPPLPNAHPAPGAGFRAAEPTTAPSASAESDRLSPGEPLNYVFLKDFRLFGFQNQDNRCPMFHITDLKRKKFRTERRLLCNMAPVM